MSQNEEKPESQQVSQPAGEARGEALAPQGQGGPHLPDISEPTSQSLSEQFESGPDPVELAKGSEAEQPAEEPHGTEVLTTDPPHRCFICKGPDHRACGCEAKAGSRMDQELDREDDNAQKVIGDRLAKAISNASGLDPQIIQMCAAGGKKFAEDMQNLLDRLSDINTNLETLVKLEQDRADLLKDLQNAGANKD